MIKSTKKIVFDSHAILKWTQMDVGYKNVKSLIEACCNQSRSGYMNQINIGEIYYKKIRTEWIDRAREFLENIVRLPLMIVLPDRELIWKAAEIKLIILSHMPIALLYLPL